jgi:Protein of unknown function (DUF3160)
MPRLRTALVLPALALLAACTEHLGPAPRPPVARPTPAVSAAAPPRAAAAPSGGSCAAPALSADISPIPPPTPEQLEEDAQTVHAVPEDPRDLCATATSNLSRAEKAILGSAASPRAAVSAHPWDRKSPPAGLDRIARRFALGSGERAALSRHGFVVPARLEFPSYANAYHEIYLSELPLFVSADAVFHAVYTGNDKILASLEERRLMPLVDHLLDALHCALPAAAADYPGETARDLDVYLTVARSLLADQAAPAAIEGDDAIASALVDQAKDAKGMTDVELFGRKRRIDFTQFTIRGHYADTPALGRYFRAAMWLARLELNVVSRSCRSSEGSDSADPRETPREALDALALADLAGRAGVMDHVDAMDRAFAAFGGRREDLSLAKLAALRAAASIGSLKEPSAFERLKAVIGEGFQRTTKIHYMPEGTSTLPVIATMLGPRIVADTAATQALVEPQTPDRHVVGAAEIAYALGQDRARAYLGDEIRRFPALATQLVEARAIAHQKPGEDLYSAWLQAILALGDKPAGAVPSFMKDEAFEDFRLDTTIAAFGQIRHNAVLFAGQGYDQGGCEIPDGYVEPVPAAFDALIAYAEKGAAALATVDPHDEGHARAYFGRLAQVLRVLRAIAADELAGRALSTEERRWLSMVLEMTPGSSGGPPTFTGWYFDLFPTHPDGLADASFIADYFTSGWEQTISYAGASSPRLGVFVVDTGGGPRAFVGPVARAFEHHGPLAHRLDDEASRHLASVDDPWAASYTVKAPPNVPLRVGVSPGDDPKASITIESPRALGAVTIELYDHHRNVLATITHAAGAGITDIPFKSPGKPVEAFHVKVGAFHRWAEVSWQGGSIDTMPTD